MPDFHFGLSGKLLRSSRETWLVERGSSLGREPVGEAVHDRGLGEGLAAPAYLGSGCPVPLDTCGALYPPGTCALPIDVQYKWNMCDCCPKSAVPADPAQQTLLGSGKQRVRAFSPLSPSQMSWCHSSVALRYGRAVQWYVTLAHRGGFPFFFARGLPELWLQLRAALCH